ncbi:ribonucleoside-diphosphate reductase class II [Anaerobranca californiensis DSM 14826]|uniref:Vitamin B12-dependent ribonucleotide reductase n=1 Tax=Anaerobranca californiensis DSM 14826 TaxID=1120989 RepID=A0A1M6PJV8_9FIRM|nr:vitamin B12-dependent ribonucleotide reductase [Anaerobranca californiensis]SHK08242.1 ribonucleoside-diphosphate reductase class II [Anaerobranca californiensis DSM 14826]
MKGKAQLSANALTVLERRYLKKEGGKVIETPEDMFKRVALNISEAEKKYGKNDEEIREIAEKFYELMISLAFLPNSPTLMNAGRELQQLAACFVLPVEDSMESIFETIKNAALIHKSGGGTGFSFSRIRPQKDRVLTTGGVASGPISFMKVFNAATEAVKQGGTRRGANMGILRVDHPDILEFITVKQNNEELTNFNLSVGITEKFMEAVEKDEHYDLINPRNKEKVKSLRAREVFDLIVDSAWKSGEPGIVFLDRINEKNPTPLLGEIESTNPCGEQPLLPYEACNLGSINLAKVVRDGEIDYNYLKDIVHLSVRFLDNVIDMGVYPLKEITEMVHGNRKIGLGVMGFADCLIKLGIPYNSEKGVKVAEQLMEFIQKESKMASEKLAEERGSFPNFHLSIYPDMGYKALRNATTTTIAPTGTISMIAGVSSGIEPIFALCYKRTILDNEELLEVHPLFEEVAKARGFYSEELMEKIAQKGSIQGLKEIPVDVQKIFVTAHDISPQWHVEIQSAFQKYTDNAVSKTVNFPYDATREDVKEVFMLSYKLKCKGVTVYRDGSRDSQVLSKVDNKEKEGVSKGEVFPVNSIVPRPRPDITVGTTEKVKIGCGNLYISVNSDEYGICEVFTNTGRDGGCASQSEATSRLISIALRSGISEETIIEQLRGIRCPACIRRPGINVTSCPDAISRAIKKIGSLKKEQYRVKEEITATSLNEESKKEKPSCPECGKPIRFESGCIICTNCGYSKCG